MFFQVPVVHLCGGDVTEGAFDEAIRHSITKMSHLHFVTNEPARKRVLQLGEADNTVFNVGSPALDLLTQMEFMSREDLAANLEAQFSENNFLITYHPVTLTSGDVRAAMEEQIDQLLAALGSFENSSFFFTKTNSDSFYSSINEKIEKFCSKNATAYFFDSLGQKRYWSLMNEVDAVVGNSSSGLYEAPTLKKQTVNIGERQKGRLMASSVIQCGNDQSAIKKAIEKALSLDTSNATNPYGEGGTASKIKNQLEKVKDFSSLVQKSFSDLS